MVIDPIIRQKQLSVLDVLFETNKEVQDEYEAQKLICIAMRKLKEENNLDNYRITSYVQDDSKRLWKQGKGERNEFIKLFMNEIESAKELYGLTRSEVLFLYSLSPYLSWEENLLIDKEGIPLNKKRLAAELELDSKTIFNRVKALEEKKCLIRLWIGRDTFYIINPNLMFKGQKINKAIPKVFEMIGYKYATAIIKG